MNKLMIAAAAALSLAGSLVVACSSSSGIAAPGANDVDAASVGSGTLPCDVQAVLVKDCQSCHGARPTFGAPMPLVSYEDLVAPAKSDASKKVYELVAKRIHDDAAPMPQPPNARLDAASTAVLDNWVAAGAPAGKTACDASDGGTGTSVQPLTCAPDQLIRPAAKFAIPVVDDLYVCYGFDTTDADAKRHVIAGAPHIDNTALVHHVLLYQADEAYPGTPQPCGAGGASGWRLVTGWAPGGRNFELPPEAGFAEEKGTTHWAVQIHYNNVAGKSGESDATGYDLCSTHDLRPNDADIMATGTMKIDIPARSNWQTDCDMTVPKAFPDITVISSWAHMHKLGAAEGAQRIRDGQSATLLDAPSYSFNNGATAYPVKVDVKAGDTLHTSCQWNNPGDTPVSFGEATADEMCFAFLTYYPKIATLDWRAPAVLGKCTSKSVP